VTILRSALEEVRARPAVRVGLPSPMPFASLADAEVSRILLNARRVLRREYLRQPYWALARNIFGVGSTVGAELCRRAGIDPDQLVGEKEKATP
jgi:hypothetical protein